jgi:hypothetical protein
MPNWRKVVVSGSDAILNSVTASFTGSLTGTLIGTASWASSASNALTSSRATSASYALSASYAPASPAFPYVGAAVITGSLIVSGAAGGIDTIGGTLTDANNYGRVEWTAGVLRNSSNIPTLDWESNSLTDSSNTLSVDWEIRRLSTPGGLRALEYDGETFTNSQLYFRTTLNGPTQQSLIDNSLYSGQVISGSINGTVNNFNLVLLDTTGEWIPARNDTANRSRKMLGICVDTASGYVLLEGDIPVSDDNSQGPYVIGADYGLPVYIHSVNGEMTTTIPTTGVIRTVGHIYQQNTTDTNLWLMKFRPSNDWYEL